MAIEQFVVQYVVEVREKDPGIGADKLWMMYQDRFNSEYRVERDVFRSILHERGLNIVQKTRATRTTNYRHNLLTYPNSVKNLIPTHPNHVWVSDINYVPIEDPTARLDHRIWFLTLIMDAYRAQSYT